MIYKPIESTLAEKYPHIDINDHLWQELISSGNEYGLGWHSLIIELVEKIGDIYKKKNMDIKEFKMDQIKEKYAELRVYVSSSINDVHKIIIEYENKSSEICEWCGKPGSLHEDLSIGWLYTVCDDCASELGYEKVE